MDSDDNSDSGKEEEDDDGDASQAHLNQMLAQQKQYLQMCQTSARILQVLSGYVGAPQSAHVIELESVSEESDEVSSCSTPESSSQTSNNEESASRPTSQPSTEECVIWAEPLLTCQLTTTRPQPCRDVRRLPPGVTPDDVKRSKAEAARARAVAAREMLGVQLAPRPRGQFGSASVSGSGDQRTTAVESLANAIRLGAQRRTLNSSAGGSGTIACAAQNTNASPSTEAQKEEEIPVTSQAPPTSAAHAVSTSLASTRDDFRAAMSQISSASETIRQAHSLLTSMGLGHYSLRRRIAQINNNNNPEASTATDSTETPQDQTEDASCNTVEEERTMTVQTRDLQESSSGAKTCDGNAEKVEGGKDGLGLGEDKSDTPQTTQTETSFPPLIVVRPANNDAAGDNSDQVQEHRHDTKNKCADVSSPSADEATRAEIKITDAAPPRTGEVMAPSTRLMSLVARSNMFRDVICRRDKNVSANVHPFTDVCSSAAASGSMRWSSHLQHLHQQQQQQPPSGQASSKMARGSRGSASLKPASKDGGVKAKNRTQESTSLATSLRNAMEMSDVGETSSLGSTIRSNGDQRGNLESADNTDALENAGGDTGRNSCDENSQSTEKRQVLSRKRTHKVTLQDVKHAVKFALGTLQKSGKWTSPESETKAVEESQEAVDGSEQNQEVVNGTHIENIRQLSPLGCDGTREVNNDTPGGREKRQEGAGVKRVTFLNEPIVITSGCKQTENCTDATLTKHDSKHEGDQESSTRHEPSPGSITNSEPGEDRIVVNSSLHSPERSEQDAVLDEIASNQCLTNQSSRETISRSEDLEPLDTPSPPQSESQRGSTTVHVIAGGLDGQGDSPNAVVCHNDASSVNWRREVSGDQDCTAPVTNQVKAEGIEMYGTPKVQGPGVVVCAYHLIEEARTAEDAWESSCHDLEEIQEGYNSDGRGEDSKICSGDAESIANPSETKLKEKNEVISNEMRSLDKYDLDETAICDTDADKSVTTCDDQPSSVLGGRKSQLNDVRQGSGDMTLVYDTGACEWVANIYSAKDNENDMETLEKPEETPTKGTHEGGPFVGDCEASTKDTSEVLCESDARKKHKDVATEKSMKCVDESTSDIGGGVPYVTAASPDDHFLVLVGSDEQGTDRQNVLQADITADAVQTKNGVVLVTETDATKTRTEKEESIPTQDSSLSKPIQDVVDNVSDSTSKECSIDNSELARVMFSNFPENEQTTCLAGYISDDETFHKSDPDSVRADSGRAACPTPISSSSFDKATVTVTDRPALRGKDHFSSTGDIRGMEGGVDKIAPPPKRSASHTSLLVRTASSQTDGGASWEWKRRNTRPGKYSRSQASRPRPSSDGATTSKHWMQCTGDQGKLNRTSGTHTLNIWSESEQSKPRRGGENNPRPSSVVKRNKYTRKPEAEEFSSARSTSVSIIEMLEERRPEELVLPDPAAALSPDLPNGTGDGVKVRETAWADADEAGGDAVKVKVSGESSPLESDEDSETAREKPRRFKFSAFGVQRRMRFRRRRRRRRSRTLGWWGRGVRCVRSRLRRWFGACFK